MKVGQRAFTDRVSVDQLAVLGTQRLALRLADRDAMATQRARGIDDADAPELLPTTSVDRDTTASVAPPNYGAWHEAVALLHSGTEPPTTDELRNMLAMAEDFGIPRATAIQDIFDQVAGPNQSAEVTDWLALLLKNADAVDLDALSRLLKTLEMLSHPERTASANGGRNAADATRETAPATLDGLQQVGTALGVADTGGGASTSSTGTTSTGTTSTAGTTTTTGVTDTAEVTTTEDFVKQSGAELASATLDFGNERMATASDDTRGQAYETLVFTFAGAPNEAFANAVKADALAYIASVPGLQEACDRMIAASGVIPEREDRMRVELALYHFEAFGAAEGRSFGATQADVVRLLAASEVGLDTRGPTILDLSNATGRTTGYPVAREANVFLEVGGSNNNVDMCTNPYPGPSGVGNALLGGSNNEGQVDLVGTIMIQAGDHNTWVVKDPSLRIDPRTELQAYDKAALADNAQKQTIMLEGNSADWSVCVDATTATYTNTATGTSVQIPASAQDQVQYASPSEIAETVAGLTGS